MALDTFDMIIIGGGTAGLVLAARLSEDPAVQVAVLESGEDHSSDLKVQTPGMWPFLRNSPMDWAFRSSLQSGRKGNSLPMPQGRMLGGTSGINGFAFAPSTRSNLDFWKELGNNGWGYDAIDRATRKAVTIHYPTGASEGSGPIHLTAWLSSSYSPCDSFSATQRGVIANLDAIDPVSKARCYSANAYLEPARSRTNLTVLTGSTVYKIVFKKDAPNGVPIADGVLFKSKYGSTTAVHARKEVILAAGAINSPRILELSGIGSRSRLEKLGIDVVVDNPYVGENFQNHVYAGFSMEVRDEVETLDPFFRQEPEAVAAARETYEQGKGGPVGRSTNLCFAPMPLREVTDEQGLKGIGQLLDDSASGSVGSSIVTPAFKKAWETYIRGEITSSTEAAVRFMFVPGFAPWESDNPLYRAPGNHFTIAMMLSHPISRGSVHIDSSSHHHSDKNTGMTVDLGLVGHPLDIEILARYLMFAETDLTRLTPFAMLLKPQEDRFTDIEKARDYIRAVLNSAHHYVGTCSMMSQEMGGVVDDNLRVYGCANLRVCDASIIPVAPRNNSQAVVYGVAEHGAQIIKEGIRKGEL